MAFMNVKMVKSHLIILHKIISVECLYFGFTLENEFVQTDIKCRFCVHNIITLAGSHARTHVRTNAPNQIII